ncbi:hypothetical protein AB1L30_14080 [Bremerella sp. JC817]|uniref:hypothetical protein n=1 Tax=Bremerella sp. JC817 TaxID=3231756 RepID=UPI00345A95AE
MFRLLAFRWSLRTLLLLVALVAGACALVIATMPRDDSAQIELLEKHGISVFYEWKSSRLWPWSKSMVASAVTMEHTEFQGDIVDGQAQLPPAVVAAMQQCHGLKVIALDSCSLRSEDLLAMPFLSELTVIWLPGSNVDDRLLQAIQQNEALDELNLGNTPITDAGIRHIARLPNLGFLTIGGPHVTTACLADLVDLKRLQELHLVSGPFHADDLAALTGMPNLTLTVACKPSAFPVEAMPNPSGLQLFFIDDQPLDEADQAALETLRSRGILVDVAASWY